MANGDGNGTKTKARRKRKKVLWVEIIGLRSPRKASSGSGAGGNSDCGTEGLLGSLIMI